MISGLEWRVYVGKYKKDEVERWVWVILKIV